jgi:nitrate reductase gamma subunit
VMETLLEWARGPILHGALAFMILGLLRHVVITVYEIWRVMHRAGDKTIPYSAVAKATLGWLIPLQKVKSRLLYSVTTVSFHVSLLIVPVFLAGHIILWQRATGLAWPAIPNMLADVLTIVVLVSALALIVERVASRDTRTLSRPGDYIIPLLVALPFASGYLVMHPSLNPFSFQIVMLLHVMSANLIMILIPITKLSHCALLPATQLIAETAWHFPPHAGSRVAAILGKENEPI